MTTSTASSANYVKSDEYGTVRIMQELLVVATAAGS